MDTQKQSSSITIHTIPPAQLWIGQHEQLFQEVQFFLQKIFCPYNCCQTCITCLHIRDKQHHAIMWFYPDKTYTIDQLEDLFTTIAYTLQLNEKFFFIIQKADFLTTTCANKLLKPMEEPPAGYHFILLAEHAEQILPTITSRCIIQTFSSKTNNYTNHLLFQSFTTQYCSPVEFSKILDSLGINERESVELFNEIFHYWLEQLNKNNSISDNNIHLKHTIILIFKNAHLQLPMPGSSSLFWRNLYLNLYPIIITLK